MAAATVKRAKMAMDFMIGVSVVWEIVRGEARRFLIPSSIFRT
jgi:hypothetical protein